MRKVDRVTFCVISQRKINVSQGLKKIKGNFDSMNNEKGAVSFPLLSLSLKNSEIHFFVSRVD